MPLALLVEKPELWMPGPWLGAVGVTAALLILMVAMGIAHLASRRGSDLLWSVARERTMQWVLAWALGVSVFTVAGFFVIPMETIQGVAYSLWRLPLVESAKWEVTVPAVTENQPVELRVELPEVDTMEMTSDASVTVINRARAGRGREQIYFIAPERAAKWDRGTNPVDRRMTEWLVTNTSPREARLTIDIAANVEYPEAQTIFLGMGVLLAVVGAYLGVRLAFPKVSAVAMASAQETMSQWLFWLVLAGGILLTKPMMLPVPSLMHIPYNTFGEDIKMLKQGGVRVVAVLAIVVALWSASTSIADELEGRTALTLLSKPLSRRQFLVGKFLGIVWPVVAMTLILGSIMLWTVSSKVVYDMRESASDAEVTWQLCHQEMIRTAPALFLGFLEVVVLTAISVALSTRLPMLANLVVSVSVYALGHLAPLVVQSAEGRFPIIAFAGQLIATVFPVLDHFDVPGALVGTAEVPVDYLVWSTVYAALYSAAAIVFALALFEDRDLA